MRQSIASLLSPSLAIASGLLGSWPQTASLAKDNSLAQRGAESSVTNLAELSPGALASLKIETFYVTSFHHTGPVSGNTITLAAVVQRGSSFRVKLTSRF